MPALLHLKREAPPLSVLSIKSLVDLLLDIERKLIAGPWDEWDAVALEQCRAVVAYLEKALYGRRPADRDGPVRERTAAYVELLTEGMKALDAANEELAAAKAALAPTPPGPPPVPRSNRRKDVA